MTALSEALLQSMIDGVLETPPWSEFVKLLRQEFDADLANLSFRRPDADRSVYVSDSSTKLRERYYQEFRDQDPIDYFGMERGRAYLIEDFLAGGRDVRFIADFLKPSGIHHLMICCTDEPGGYRAWLTVTRGAEGAPFSDSFRSRFQRTAERFSSALGVFSALKRAEFDLELHRRATRALALGTIIIDQNGRVLSIDAEAQWKLSTQTMLHIRAGRLRLAGRSLDKELQSHLAALLQDDGRSRTLSMSVGGDLRLELLLCAAASPLDFSGSTPAVTIYLRSELDNALADADSIAELFQLGRREAQLASLLARGRTLAEAAAELNITESTARTYSKRIYDKTGVRRQTELVRRILTSVAPLASIHER